MNMPKFYLTFLVLALETVYCKNAQSVTIYGNGATASCGTWTEARREEFAGVGISSGFLANWAEGYLSARALLLNKEIIYGLDASTIEQWLDSYCATYPTLRFTTALNMLIDSNQGNLPPGFVLEPKER